MKTDRTQNMPYSINSKNVNKNSQKGNLFSGIIPIFALELKPLRRSNSSVNRNGVFLSPNLDNSIELLNLSGSRYKTLLTVSKQRFSSSFFIFKHLIFRQMRRSEENVNSVKNSTAVSTSSPTTLGAIQKSDNAVIAATEPQPAVEKPTKHYYIVSARSLGRWAQDYRSGLYISRILREVSRESAIGRLVEYIKATFQDHSILAKDVECTTFNYINPQI